MNIVFDLGGVLLFWSPDRIVSRVVDDPEQAVRIRKALFEHPDWIELDRGTIDEDDLILRTADRAGVSYETAKKVIRSVPASLEPMEDSVELATDLSRSGHDLYYLSNITRPSMDYLEAHHFRKGGALGLIFAGGVASCREKLVKPDPKIFELLLHRFRLERSGTVFIDDTGRNVDAAAQVGMKSIHFQDASQCRRELEKLGVC